MNKITVIGDTGSGKTCFLYAMYHYLSYGHITGFTVGCMNSDGYNSKPDFEKDSELEDFYNRLADISRGVDRFPPRSNQREPYVFSLKHKLKDVVFFKWVDYPGGYINNNGGGREDFIEDLRSSDSWVIFIDGEKLYRALIEIIDVNERNMFIKDNIFGRYIRCMQYNAEIIPSFISIIVTKSDLLLKPLIKKWYNNLSDISPVERTKNAMISAKEEVTQVIKEHFFNNIEMDRYQVSVSYVSLGDKISENNYTGILDPVNIDFPITISILSILENKYREINHKIARMETEIEEIRQSLFASKDKRIAMQEEIDKQLKPKLNHWEKVAKAIIDRIKDDVILYNQGENNTISIKNYYLQVFNIN